jgi:hypothetical protein
MKCKTAEAVLVHAAEEHRAHGVGPQARPVGLVEHEALIGEVRTDQQALLEHPAAVVPKCRDGRGIERDRSASARRLSARPPSPCSASA